MLATIYRRITRNQLAQPLADQLSLALTLAVTTILTAGSGFVLDLAITLGACGGGGSSGCSL